MYDKKEKAWKINCRNWECGVVLPVAAEKLAPVKQETTKLRPEKVEGGDSETESEDDGEGANADASRLVGMNVFNGLFEPPFQIPGALFDGRDPWYFQERSG